jgi:hypothetical protein
MIRKEFPVVNPSRRELLASLCALPALAVESDPWIPLFDGKSLQGWKENRPGSWNVRDGALVADGPLCHIFYTGPVRSAAFRNFELKAEVMTRPGANSGVYFHTQYDAGDWPKNGFEVQVNNTHRGAGDYREYKKGGSLYGVRNVYKAFAKDNEWFRLHILVRGKQVQVRLNDLLLVDYVEAEPPATQVALGAGTFALQCHDPNSKVHYRNIMVRALPDDLATPGERPVVDDIYRKVLAYGAANVPVVDYHVHLKGGWAIEQALEHSRKHGIQYGIALNCGKQMGAETDREALEFINALQGQPVFVAMQAEGREWVTMFSPETVARFDYVFTDSMTWTDDNGRRMRTWIKQEVGEIADPQRFMDTLVKRAVGILTDEPVDIYVNPTFIPDVIGERYDELWTPSRMDRVIEAAVKNGVAIEINNRYKLPGPAFLKRAKAAGAKFSFGTNNDGANIGRNEYGFQMADELGLKWQDFFVPKPHGEKPIQVKGFRRSS